MTRFVATFAALIAIPVAVLAEESGGPVLVFAEDFESEPYSFQHSNVEPAPGEGVDGGTAALFTYVGSDVGSDRIVRRITLDERGTEYTLSYDVRFDEDFQFVRGGKLHGLGPDRVISGGQERRPDGWSARVNFAGGGGVRTYIYEQDGETQWGVGRSSSGFTFERGRYHAVSLHLKLNDPPEEANGFAHVHVDGEQVISHDDLRLRGEAGEHTHISQFLISTFHGGSSPEWAPMDEDGEYVDVYAWLDNIEVHRGRYVRAEPGAAPEEAESRTQE